MVLAQVVADGHAVHATLVILDQPEVAARAIWKAAHSTRKQWIVGVPAYQAIIADKVASPLLDRQLAGGMIEAGRPADLVLLDLDADPTDNYEQTALRVIENGGPHIVRTVWVAGRVVASDGRPRLAEPPSESEEDALRERMLPRVMAEADRRPVRRASPAASRSRAWP